MSIDNKRYELGNYAKDWGNRVVKILGINITNVLVEYEGEEEATLDWHDISPIQIRSGLLKEIGFSLIEEKRNPYHIRYSMSIILGGKYHNAIGIEYEDKSLWSFKNVSVLYIHQLQNLISIIMPSTCLRIQSLHL
jgi:hypothetical protein